MTAALTFAAYMAQRQAAPPHRAMLADQAIALGVPVFPCAADKRPLTAHGFKDASADPAAIRAMFARPDAALIGVPTGPASGWHVVDVDIKDGARGMEWLNAHSADLGPTRTHRTRNGGLHLVYRLPEGAPEVRNSASRIAPGVDVRGVGGYVVAPPSPGYTVADETAPAVMPKWLVEACSKPPPPAPPTSAVPRPRRAVEGGTAYGRSALEAECRAIATAGQGQKHDTLNRGAYAIGGLVAAGELPESEAFASLSDALGAIRGACKDFRAAERTLRRAFDDGKRDARQPPPDMAPPPPPEEVHPAAGLLAKLHGAAAKRQREAARAAGAIPAGVYAVDGVLKRMLDHCTASAFKPQPFLALAAAICAVAAAGGRRYQTESRLRTNIYAAAIADSGSGKDHAIGYAREALYAAGLDGHVGGEDLASGAGVLTSLQQHPARLFLIDEFGLFISGVTGQRAAPHKAEIWALLMKLYSRAGGRFNGKEYANAKEKPRVDLHQPHACLYGATTPSTFWAALENGAMADGSLARFLVFQTDRNVVPRNRAPAAPEVPQDIADALREIAAGVVGHDHGGNIAGAMLSGAPMTPFTVPMDHGGRRAMESFLDRQEAWQAEVENTPKAAIVARVGENAAKLALIAAVSRHPQAPTITEADVAWGTLLAEHCAQTLLREANRFMADSDYERKVNRLIEIITKHGPVSDAEIFDRHSFRLPGRERTDMLRDLVGAGVILTVQCPSGPRGGRPTTRYIVANRAGAGDDEEVG